MSTLIKIDKNGTKYYANYACPRCGGAGGSDAWAYTGWTCYECGGTGKAIKPRIFKEYTPEYKAKLDARRLERAKAQAPKVNAEFFKKMGMNENGKAWIVLGNTYEIKDDLKAAGAKFNNLLGWHFDHEPSEYNCFELSVDEIAETDKAGVWELFDDWWVQKIVKEQKDAHAPKTASEYIGEVGQKLTVDVSLTRICQFETHFTYRGETSYIYKFADVNGNTITWKTAKHLDIEEGWTGKVTGTVKEHSEYKGDKQTVLTRCKIEGGKEI